ncbi:hypothetical protein BpHYR1_049887 [Brachionus plicatilis]|uniref:Uncharacterized protein n=1 Tax=Brachionus plicatilis TaxID=10195 RepID=A0A3M7QEX6_BRAPC|nr:hypothetical protein BpHYR1_049887 [Brachionus plicatilis]
MVLIKISLRKMITILHQNSFAFETQSLFDRARRAGARALPPLGSEHGAWSGLRVTLRLWRMGTTLKLKEELIQIHLVLLSGKSLCVEKYCSGIIHCETGFNTGPKIQIAPLEYVIRNLYSNQLKNSICHLNQLNLFKI